MTVSVNISPELEARLTARARSTGRSVESLIQDVIEREAASSASSCEATGSEKARAFHRWAKSFPADLPILSLESVSRESIYQRD
jgi:hypothetical protein